jgi:serine phosphatase RsbU (regulator of sigma subunit)
LFLEKQVEKLRFLLQTQYRLFKAMESLEVQVAVAKINKYAASESGDTVEVIERPHGGLSIVLADGQRSGRSAKIISNKVVRKAISLLAEGVRDGAAARATHDYLHTERGGKVSAELVIVSVDLITRTLVVSRNSHCPSLLRQGDEFRWLDEASEAIGIHRHTKPAISEVALAPWITLLVCSDGVWSAGERRGLVFDAAAYLHEIDTASTCPAQLVADAILNHVLELEQQRPHDDVTVLVLKITPGSDNQTAHGLVRRMTIGFPIG